MEFFACGNDMFQGVVTNFNSVFGKEITNQTGEGDEIS